VLLNRVPGVDKGIWLTDPDLAKRGVDCVIVLIALRIVSLADFSPAAKGEVDTGDILNGVVTKEETEEVEVTADEQAVSPIPRGIANLGKLPPR